ncbi:MAG: hypothetical protein DRI39_06970 [Chloroflexi bacterium]|nr:MAG: hypothetical protein DRI39_06970 [Chloroflexota bacterium]RLC96578.1 MAG: hypothetical protein DRI40_02725 [Chloroflexota bacterium]
MSLVIATYVPEGIVMASDSRQSITIDGKDTQGKRFKVETVNSDAVTKTFYLKEQGVGISTYGVDLLGGTPMSSHIERFRQEALTDKDDVVTVARKLVDYVRGQFSDVDAGFHVCGYRKEGKLSAAHVYSCHVGRNVVERKNTKPDGSLRYGATWSGQIDIITSIVNPVVVKDEKGADKIVRPAPPILWDAMTLQDAIDFSVYAIRTTIDTMRFQARPKNVGGPIDVLVLTPNEGRWISKKELHQ